MSTSGILTSFGAIASVLLVISVPVIAGGIILAVWQFHKTQKKLNVLLDRLSVDIGPLIHNATVVSDDVREIVSTTKRSVRDVNETVQTASAELKTAVQGVGERIGQFNALIGAVQDQTESAFVSAAATVRGVREGLGAAIRGTGRSGASRPRRAPAREDLREDADESMADELDATLDDAFDDELEEDLEDEEELFYDDDYDDEPPPRSAQYGPRIRPRPAKERDG